MTAKPRMEDDSEKHRTETVTFRLSSKLITDLRNDAKLENISLNSFVTKIFTNHVQWERYERKFGLLPMTKPFLMKVLSRISDPQIIDLAQKIEKDNFRAIMAFIKENPSTRDFIEILRSWLTVSWMRNDLHVHEDGANHFMIQHDMDIKWSLYLKVLVSELYRDIFGKNVNIRITDKTLSLVFE